MRKGARATKFGHIGLPVVDVRATRDLFDRYFGFRCTFEMEPDRFVGLTDDAGLLLRISNLDDFSEVVYPKWFPYWMQARFRPIVDNVHAFRHPNE